MGNRSFRLGKKSFTARILRLYATGISQYKISRMLGCTESNVYQAIKREKARLKLQGQTLLGGLKHPWSGRIAPLTQEQTDWLELEAQRIGTTPDVVARSMLSDAIDDEREKLNEIPRQQHG